MLGACNASLARQRREGEEVSRQEVGVGWNTAREWGWSANLPVKSPSGSAATVAAQRQVIQVIQVICNTEPAVPR